MITESKRGILLVTSMFVPMNTSSPFWQDQYPKVGIYRHDPLKDQTGNGFDLIPCGEWCVHRQAHYTTRRLAKGWRRHLRRLKAMKRRS